MPSRECITCNRTRVGIGCGMPMGTLHVPVRFIVARRGAGECVCSLSVTVFGNRFFRALGLWQQFDNARRKRADTPSGLGRHGGWHAKPAGVEFGGCDIGIGAVNLIRYQQYRLAEPAQVTGNTLVHWCKAIANVHHEQHDIGFACGLQRLGVDQTVQKGLVDGLTCVGRKVGARGCRLCGVEPTQAAGIDHQPRTKLDPRGAETAVAGHPRLVDDQCITGRSELVEERGLTDVRAPENGHYRQHLRHRVQGARSVSKARSPSLV